MRKTTAVRWVIAAACLLAVGVASCGEGGPAASAGLRARTPSAIPSVALDCGDTECIR